MLNTAGKKIIDDAKAAGWVLEPRAKALMQMQGMDIPEFVLTDSLDEAAAFLDQAGGPVVAKAVSGKILHKTEHQAVVTGISLGDHLKQEMERLLGLDGCQKVLIEHMVKGIELIVGAKNDHQFGPVVVLGLGGTGVEVYNDTAIRMAPLKPEDVLSMAQSLTAREMIFGFRGNRGVNMDALTRMMVAFSTFVMELENQFQSVDLNPVICTQDKCVIADARIIL